MSNSQTPKLLSDIYNQLSTLEGCKGNMNDIITEGLKITAAAVVRFGTFVQTKMQDICNKTLPNERHVLLPFQATAIINGFEISNHITNLTGSFFIHIMENDYDNIQSISDMAEIQIKILESEYHRFQNNDKKIQFLTNEIRIHFSSGIEVGKAMIRLGNKLNSLLRTYHIDSSISVSDDVKKQMYTMINQVIIVAQYMEELLWTFEERVQN